MLGNISQFASAPGIDPRTWIMWARVTKVAQDDEGVWADIQCLKTGVHDTAYVGTNQAGDQSGDWNTLAIGEVVVVAVPYGDADNGPVIICRRWGPGQRPMEESRNSSDRVIKQRGTNALRLLAELADLQLKSGLKVLVEAPQVVVDAQQVSLGAAMAVSPVALATPLLAYLNTVFAALTDVNAKLTTLGLPLAVTPVAPPSAIAAQNVRAQ